MLLHTSASHPSHNRTLSDAHLQPTLFYSLILSCFLLDYLGSFHLTKSRFISKLRQSFCFAWATYFTTLSAAICSSCNVPQRISSTATMMALPEFKTVPCSAAFISVWWFYGLFHSTSSCVNSSPQRDIQLRGWASAVRIFILVSGFIVFSCTISFMCRGAEILSQRELQFLHWSTIQRETNITTVKKSLISKIYNILQNITVADFLTELDKICRLLKATNSSCV